MPHLLRQHLTLNWMGNSAFRALAHRKKVFFWLWPRCMDCIDHLFHVLTRSLGKFAVWMRGCQSVNSGAVNMLSSFSFMTTVFGAGRSVVVLPCAIEFLNLNISDRVCKGRAPSPPGNTTPSFSHTKSNFSEVFRRSNSSKL